MRVREDQQGSLARWPGRFFAPMGERFRRPKRSRPAALGERTDRALRSAALTQQCAEIHHGLIEPRGLRPALWQDGFGPLPQRFLDFLAGYISGNRKIPCQDPADIAIKNRVALIAGQAQYGTGG